MEAERTVRLRPIIKVSHTMGWGNKRQQYQYGGKPYRNCAS